MTHHEAAKNADAPSPRQNGPLARPFWSARRVALLALALLSAAFCVGLAVTRSGLHPAPFGALAVVLALAVLLDWLAGRSTNGALRGFLHRPGRYTAYSDIYPTYRHVDLFRALGRLEGLSAGARRMEHAHANASLLDLIRYPSLQPPTPSAQAKVCVGYERFAFVPTEALWLLAGPAPLRPEDRALVRLRVVHMNVMVEVACADADGAAALLKWLADESLAVSVYRGQFLEVHYHRTNHADLEYTQASPGMVITFKARPEVGDADILLDDHVRGILDRNVFEFFAHRDSLHAFGLPRKRALLFYGPPGTGKTHTCRHIHTRLSGVTSILVAGESLTRLQDIGRFARQLHPTLLVIEDVDLVFTSRERNPHGTALGELMDQLDGFTADEEVLFILTTNAIERVEEAIRDRPGRINQCLHFGLPAAGLRRRYLERYLTPFDASAVDLGHLVRRTDGASQAFLKEYVLRAVQVAAAAVGYPRGGRLRLETGHFDVALEELTGHGNPHGHAILGFRTERS
jgi:hypothetical protein